eukprot:1093978-Heterocapsa_arctica.AAC.1
MPGGPWTPAEITDWHSAQGSVADTADATADATAEAQAPMPVTVPVAQTFGHFDPAIDLETATGDARHAGNHPFYCAERLMVEQ